ncbi:MAG TPA: endolytic transglycosylase MltG [Geobacteraceae bacterium]
MAQEPLATPSTQVGTFLSRYRRQLVAAGALLLLLVAGLAAWFANFVTVPLGSGSTVRLFDLAKGAGLRSFAAELEKGKVVGSARFFVLYARFKGATGRVQAGTYQLTDGMTPAEILRRLVAGEVYEIRFSVPEGYSIYQIAELLEGRKLFRKEEFLRQCFNRELLRELGIPGKSVEGYLYPSTYDLRKASDEAALIRTMVRQFEKVYGESFAGQQPGGTGLTRHAALTLASMIEKEAVVATERPLIASVFFNRLKVGMPLQSDPTAVYGTRAFAGKVSKRDIQQDSPYNTYRIRGLPPGPIGNPGSGALAAVFKPATTPYMYFVAKNDGSHQFSTTLVEHNRAVQRYLKSAAGEAAGYRNDHPHLTGRR